MRRSGYPTKGAAQRALTDVLARYGAGVKVDDRQTVAGYKGSAAGVGLSARVVAAFERQRSRQTVARAEWAECYEDHDLVFARVNGTPVRPDWVLDRFH